MLAELAFAFGLLAASVAIHASLLTVAIRRIGPLPASAGAPSWPVIARLIGIASWLILAHLVEIARSTGLFFAVVSGLDRWDVRR